MQITRGVDRIIAERVKLALYNYETRKNQPIMTPKDREGLRCYIHADMQLKVKDLNIRFSKLSQILDKFLTPNYLRAEIARYKLIMAEASGEIEPRSIVDQVLTRDGVFVEYGLRSSILAVAIEEFERAKQARRPHCLTTVRQDIVKAIRASAAYKKAKSQQLTKSPAPTVVILHRREIFSGTLLA